MRLIFLLLISYLWIFPNNAWSQKVVVETKMTANTQKGLVSYHSNKPLKTTDFNGRPSNSTQAVALVYSGVSMLMESYQHGKTTKVVVSINAYMDPNKSWMKRKGRSDRVLNHEQKHFDLTALAACDLKKRIDATNFKEDWKATLHQIYYEEIESKLQRLQNKYDEDTTHGTVEEVQTVYNQFIEGQIQKSECF